LTNYNYLPNTQEDRQQMLKAIGVKSQEELFEHIPKSLRDVHLRIPEALSELELEKKLVELAKKNIPVGEYINFLGAGSYNRYIPAVIDNIVSRCEFLTAYTPYQPEISQGTLQSIFEFQTMICTLTGMDVANASMYDEATATAEAALMACRVTRRDRVIMARTIDPATQEVVKTYLKGPEIDLQIAPMGEEGITDLDILKNLVDKTVACVIIQMPNFLGNLEEVKKIEQITHEAGALYVICIDPISVGMIKPPGAYGADITIGNGQSLGNDLYFGGPAFGFMACKEKYMRQLPGRIVGSTVDKKGEKAFTLTLQTREQHIRREKATSNICTNHSLNALAGCIYLTILGPQGLKDVANICFQRAHYLANKVEAINGFTVPFHNFFSNFVLTLPEEIKEEDFIDYMYGKNILAGMKVGTYYNEIPNSVLVSVTELNSPVDLYLFIMAIKELAKELGLEIGGE
jgi:glycine dehydrogenase subunit 1